MNEDKAEIDLVEPPIYISEVEKDKFLFYLAGRVPVAVSQFAEDCTETELGVKNILNSRFQNEVKLDHTGFLTLTDAARSDILSFANPLISDAVAAQKRGKEIVEDGDYKDAIEHYQHAESLFSAAESRLEEVGDVPEKLTRRLESVRDTHDRIQKKVVNDVVTHRNFIAEQHEEKGDDAMQNGSYTDAADEFESAVNALVEAKDAVETYNTQLLSADSSRLDISKIERRIQALDRKANRAKKNLSEDGNSNSRELSQQQSDQSKSSRSSSSAVEEETQVSQPSIDNQARGNLIEILRELHERLGEVPNTTELVYHTDRSPNEYYQEFGGWEEALDAAGIDKEEAMINEIERVADKIGRVPKSTDMDEHSSYSGSNYSSYFDSWTTALEQADLPDEIVSSKEDRREEILETIRSLHESLGRLPKGTDLQNNQNLSQQEVTSTFGSWDEALEAADIDKEQLLIEELQRVAEEVGGRPKTTDMNHIGQHSAGMYNKFFGSWGDAIAAADLGDSSTQAQTDDQTTKSSTHSESTSTETDDDEFEQALVDAGIIDELGEGKETETTSERSNSTIDTPNPDDFAAISDMQPNKRHSDEIAIKLETESYAGAKKDAAFEVTDASGEIVRLDFWSKHGLDIPESTGTWYVMEELRLKQWENDGETNRNLSSSRDTQWRQIGNDDSKGSLNSEDDQAKATEATSQSESATETQEEASDESGGMLGSIVSEFDDDLV